MHCGYEQRWRITTMSGCTRRGRVMCSLNWIIAFNFTWAKGFVWYFIAVLNHDRPRPNILLLVESHACSDNKVGNHRSDTTIKRFNNIRWVTWKLKIVSSLNVAYFVISIAMRSTKDVLKAVLQRYFKWLRQI